MIERRAFLTGLISLVAAPAIVRAGSLMPVKADLIWGEQLRFSLPVGEVYGCSPAMSMLRDLAEIRERINLAFFDDLLRLQTPPARRCP